METIGTIFGIDVEVNEIPRSNGRPYVSHIPKSGVLHTTEGSSVAGALAALAKSKSPSHFVIGENRIVQLRPINVQAAALHANAPHNPNDGVIQIEMVARSSQQLWLPEDGTLQPTIKLMAWLNKNLAIPLSIPNDWPDDCSDIKTIWASNNTRRQQTAKTWPEPYGWYMHLEIAWQEPTWHYDCGALKRSEMIKMAQELVNTIN